MPSGARFRKVHRENARPLTWRTAPGDGVVYTAVTDGPWMDLAGAVRDLPHADPPGRLRKVAQAVVSLFRWR